MKNEPNDKWNQKINSEDYIKRESLAVYLGKRRNIPEAPELLLRLLKDQEPIVRSAAINSLIKFKDEKYFQKVLPLLHDKDEVVRINAVECVSYLGGEAIRHLLEHLDDRSEVVRRYVAGWIGELGDKVLAKHLEKRLEHEHSSLAKVGLLEGLYLLGQKERLLSLTHLLKSKRYVVRCAVANMLPSLVNKENKELIRDALLRASQTEQTEAAKSSIANALQQIKRPKDKKLGPREER